MKPLRRCVFAGCLLALMIPGSQGRALAAGARVQILIRLIPVSIETGRDDSVSPMPERDSVMKMLWLEEGEEGKVLMEESKAAPAGSLLSLLKQEKLVPEDWVQGAFRRAIFVRQKYEEGRIVLEVVPGMIDEAAEAEKILKFEKYAVSIAVPLGEPAEMGAGLQFAHFENEFYRDEDGNPLKILLTPMPAG